MSDSALKQSDPVADNVEPVALPSQPPLSAQVRVFGLLYLAYGFSMALRTLPAMTSTEICGDPAMGIRLGEWGQVVGIGTWGGLTGKFLWGWLADVLGGRVTMTLGLLLAALGTIGFSLAENQMQVSLAVFVMFLAQAAGWPSMIRLVAVWATPVQAGRVWGILSTSSRVGVLLVTWGLAEYVAADSVGWRGLVRMMALVTLPLAAVYALLIQSRPAQVNESVAPQPMSTEPLSQALLRFCRSSQCWLICGSLMGMAVMWDVLQLIPLFLQQSMGMSAGVAGRTASAFPAGSLLSVLVGGCLFDWLGRRRMAVIMPVLLITAAACLAAFAALPSVRLTEPNAGVAAMLLLFVFGVCLSPCYYIPASIFSAEFGRSRAGILVSLLDAAGFAATGTFYWTCTRLAESHGWSTLLWLLAGIGLIAALLLAVFLHRESDRRIRSGS